MSSDLTKPQIFGIVVVTLVIVVGGGIWTICSTIRFHSHSDDKKVFLDFFPKPKTYPDSSLIWVDRVKEKDESYWADELSRIIKEYRDENPGQTAMNCRYVNDKKANEVDYCFVDTDKMRGCIETKQDKYGYTGGITKPCVLLRLKKKYDWIPIPYKTEEDLKIAEKRGMPDELMTKIRQLNGSHPNERRKLDTIWFSCDGEGPSDKENIGPMQFFSTEADGDFPGIPKYYFPFMNQHQYQSPFVFVRFENPQVNILIRVECKIWALNIDPEKEGNSIKFELMVD